MIIYFFIQQWIMNAGNMIICITLFFFYYVKLWEQAFLSFLILCDLLLLFIVLSYNLWHKFKYSFFVVVLYIAFIDMILGILTIFNYCIYHITFFDHMIVITFTMCYLNNLKNGIILIFTILSMIYKIEDLVLIIVFSCVIYQNSIWLWCGGKSYGYDRNVSFGLDGCENTYLLYVSHWFTILN